MRSYFRNAKNPGVSFRPSLSSRRNLHPKGPTPPQRSLPASRAPSFVRPMALIRRNFMKLSYQWYWIPESYEKLDNLTQNSRKTNTIQNHSRKCPKVPSQAHLLLLLIFSAALVHSVLPCFLLAGNWSIHSCNPSLVFFEISFFSWIFSDPFSWKSFSLLAYFHLFQA